MPQFSYYGRNARKEADAGKPPKSSRELFRLLREQGE